MTQDQISPAPSAALDNGLEVTALHNHFVWDSPKIMFMHIGGVGQEQELANAAGSVFAAIRQTAGKSETSNAEIDRSIQGRRVQIRRRTNDTNA